MIDSTSFRPTAKSTRVVTVRWDIITELSSSLVSPSVSTQCAKATLAFPQHNCATNSELGIVCMCKEIYNRSGDSHGRGEGDRYVRAAIR